MAVWRVELPDKVLMTAITASNRYEEEDIAIETLCREFRNFVKKNIKKVKETNPDRPAMDSATRSRRG